MTATAAAIKRLDDLFQTIRLEEQKKNVRNKMDERVQPNSIVITKECDIHGKRTSHRRGSTEPRAGPISLNSLGTKTAHSRESLRYGWPGHVVSTLRKEQSSAVSAAAAIAAPFVSSTAATRRDVAPNANIAIGAANKQPNDDVATRRDYATNVKPSANCTLRKDGLSLARRFSTDSLDSAIRCNSWERKRESSGSSTETIREEDNINKKQNSRQDGDDQSSNGNKPKFVAVTSLEDVQAIRCAEFHPQGNLYAVGSNSKILRICAYPKLHDLKDNHKISQPTVLFKRTKHHKGSIYCMAWTPIGDLLATGSNDKTVKLMRFNNDTSNFEGQEIELAMHDGTVRDVCFLEDTSNKASLLISGGAGDCKVYVTDCATGQPYQTFSGHSGHVLSLYNWGGVMFVSGSQDRTVRFWDLRIRGCANNITPVTNGSTKGSAVAAVCVDPSGRLLITGHADSSCVLYDIRGGRTLQCFRPHTSDVRSIRFSPSAYYLLTGGYDNKLVLTDLQGDLTSALPSVVAAQHQDKVISARWHPAEFSFLSTSADKSSTLWALPSV